MQRKYTGEGRVSLKTGAGVKAWNKLIKVCLLVAIAAIKKCAYWLTKHFTSKDLIKK